MTISEMWDALINAGVSEETLQIITDINGYNSDTMRDVLYAVFGVHEFDDII